MSDVTNGIYRRFVKEEREEKEMKMTRICVDVPKELSEELMSIISRYEGVPVEGDEPFDLKLENTALKEKIAELSSTNLEQELTVCKQDKEIITKEYNNEKHLREEAQRTLEYIEEDAKLILQGICSDFTDKLSKEDFAKFMSKFTDDQLDRYELKGFIPEQEYDVVSVDVTMEKTTTIKVVVPKGTDIDSYLDEIVGESSNGLEAMCDGEATEYSFMVGNTLDENVNEQYIRYAYSQEELFCTDEVNREIYNEEY